MSAVSTKKPLKVLKVAVCCICLVSPLTGWNGRYWGLKAGIYILYACLVCSSLSWEGWLLSNRVIDAPVNQDVLTWEIKSNRSKSQTLSLCDMCLHWQKDVDSLLIAKSVFIDQPLEDPPWLCASFKVLRVAGSPHRRLLSLFLLRQREVCLNHVRPIFKVILIVIELLVCFCRKPFDVYNQDCSIHLMNSGSGKALDCVSTGLLHWDSLCIQESSYLVDPASSHMLVSKIKPCMSKYKQICTVKLRMAH
jgi:hypothetical protein